MKKSILLITMLLMATMAWADVTAEILKCDIDDNGNIRVYTQYKVDGVDVVSRYPTLDGKYYFVTRYDAMNFYGMTAKQIKARILKDINDHAANLIARKYVEDKNAAIVKDNLTTIVGSTASVVEAVIPVDSDKDGTPDINLTVKTDGTSVEEAISISVE